MFLKFKIFIYNLIFVHFKIWWMLRFNPLIREQMKNTQSIPIIIINFNQLFYLKKLVDFLKQRKFENIIIIDNLSTYPPLLEYYKTLTDVTIEYMDDNYGHIVFFQNKKIQEKYGQGFYVVTDADIVPNEKLPEDFMKILLRILVKEFNNVNKVGFALDIENIPDYYILKDNVLNWEKPFWEIKYKDNPLSYKAFIDTTFALYKPQYPIRFNNKYFYDGIRLAADFTAMHGGWYFDIINMTEEQKNYQKTSSNASSWLLNQNRNLDSKHSAKYL